MLGGLASCVTIGLLRSTVSLAHRGTGHERPHEDLGMGKISHLPCAALAIGQGNGERDAELLTDAPGDVPVAGQVFSYQDVAGGEPSLGTISRLKFRQS